MLKSRTRLFVFALAVASCAAGLAFAQDPPKPAPPATPAAAKPGDLSKDNDEEDPANAVPMGKYLETAQSAVESMRGSLTRGLDSLKDARGKKDAVQLTCV